MMGLLILNVDISKKQLKTNEQFTIKVDIKQTVKEPIIHRLPFKLGQKGSIK